MNAGLQGHRLKHFRIGLKSIGKMVIKVTREITPVPSISLFYYDSY